MTCGHSGWRWVDEINPPGFVDDRDITRAQAATRPPSPLSPPGCARNRENACGPEVSPASESETSLSAQMKLPGFGIVDQPADLALSVHRVEDHRGAPSFHSASSTTRVLREVRQVDADAIAAQRAEFPEAGGEASEASSSFAMVSRAWKYATARPSGGSAIGPPRHLPANDMRAEPATGQRRACRAGG